MTNNADNLMGYAGQPSERTAAKPLASPRDTPISNTPYQPHRQGLHSDDRPYPGEEMCYCDKPSVDNPTPEQLEREQKLGIKRYTDENGDKHLDMHDAIFHSPKLAHPSNTEQSNGAQEISTGQYLQVKDTFPNVVNQATVSSIPVERRLHIFFCALFGLDDEDHDSDDEVAPLEKFILDLIATHTAEAVTTETNRAVQATKHSERAWAYKNMRDHGTDPAWVEVAKGRLDRAEGVGTDESN